MNNLIKVLIADDHPYIIQAISTILSDYQHIKIVGAASNGNQTVEMATRLFPDIIIMDIRMPNLSGIEATKILINKDQNFKIICLTAFDDENGLVDMLKAGAKGFILKTSDTSEILRAINKVLTGEEYYCKDAIDVMIKRFIKNTPLIPRLLRFEGFSPKELEIIKLICKQKTSREISEELFLGEKTINYYRQRIMEKMKVKTSIGIVVYAIKNNMVNINDLF